MSDYNKIDKQLDEYFGNLLCSALEGGSNYWYQIVKHNREQDEYFHDIPFRINGELVIGDTDGYLKEPIKLTLPDLYKAWALMRIEYPRHWADALQENDDAATGDVFLQLAMFNKIVFG